MTRYNVHIFREMRIQFSGIEAESATIAAKIASSKTTDEAEAIEDCDGDDLGALVDVEGDADYSNSELIDFEPRRLSAVAPRLLATVRAFLAAGPYGNVEAYNVAVDGAVMILAEFSEPESATPIPTDTLATQPAWSLFEALEHVRSMLKLRHIDEASHDDVDEAIRIADEALAGARA